MFTTSIGEDGMRQQSFLNGYVKEKNRIYQRILLLKIQVKYYN